MHVCIYVFLYVSMLEDANEERGCEGVHVFRNYLATTPLKGSSSLHEADVRGGSPRLHVFPPLFLRSMLPPSSIGFGFLMSRVIRLKSGDIPRLRLLLLIFKCSSFDVGRRL